MKFHFQIFTKNAITNHLHVLLIAVITSSVLIGIVLFPVADMSTGRVGPPLTCCEIRLRDWSEGTTIRPKKKSCVTGNPTKPMGTGGPYTFLRKYRFFVIGVFIIEILFLKKTHQKTANPT